MTPLFDFRNGPRLATSLPVALRFPDGDSPEGWGRIYDISATGVRLESRWPHKIGQAVYLTFLPRNDMRLENFRARVVRVSWEEGFYLVGLVFDESVDQAYLKDALMALINET
ncbi:MAG: PilZ domain-containing protein [Elusimicrobia bacterium]|nr:PilZ domain-containing protein [Elusimicrobiota bacterium]